LLFLLAAAYNYSHFLGDPQHGLIGGADGVAYAWYLEWVHQGIVHGHNPFVSVALNAPTGVNLMWNTSIILLGFVAFPVVVNTAASFHLKASLALRSCSALTPGPKNSPDAHWLPTAAPSKDSLPTIIAVIATK
jgi:hypothetical protein